MYNFHELLQRNYICITILNLCRGISSMKFTQLQELNYLSLFQTTTLEFITGDLGNRQYADEGDEIEVHELNAEPQRSFELVGDSSSDTEDNAFMSEAPPEYYDVVHVQDSPHYDAVQDSPIPVTIETDHLTTRASVYTGSTDIPPYVAEQPHIPPQPYEPP